MDVGYRELMHECFPKHSRTGTARMKYGKETNKQGKMRGASMEEVKQSEKISPYALSLPNQNTIK